MFSKDGSPIVKLGPISSIRDKILLSPIVAEDVERWSSIWQPALGLVGPLKSILNFSDIVGGWRRWWIASSSQDRLLESLSVVNLDRL